MVNLALYSTDLQPLVRTVLRPLGAAETSAIARALAEYRSSRWPKPCGLSAPLAVIRRHLTRFKRIFGKFGRTEFLCVALPAAISAYAEEPEFLDQALANILFAAEDVKIRDISDFFSLAVPKGIRIYRFDIFELRDMRVSDFVGIMDSPIQPTERKIQTTLDTAPADIGDILARGDWIKTLEPDIREAIIGLIGEGQNPRSLFERYAAERDLEECMNQVLLPHAFRSKLQVEADPDEAAGLLDDLCLAYGKVQAFREASRKRASVIGELISDNALADTERHILDYLRTPSKAYSEIFRMRIRQSLKRLCRRIDTEMAAMRETRLGRVIRKPGFLGVVTSGEISLTKREDNSLPYLIPSDLENSNELRVKIDGPTARVYDHRGRPLLRRRDTLSSGTRVLPTVIQRKGELRGMIRARTDQDGNLVLDASRHGPATRSIDMQGVGLPPKRELVLRLSGNTAQILALPNRVEIERERLRLVMRSSRHKRLRTDDIVVFKPENCNIHLESKGHCVRDIGFKEMAQRLAQIMDVLTATYPGRRLDEILSETLEIRVEPGDGRKLAGSDLNANTILHLEAVDPAVLAAALVHEDAHCLASKTLFSDEEYVAETHRDQRPYFGMKTVLETVQEGITEIFARLVELRFCLDAIRNGSARLRILRKNINQAFKLIASDVGHFSSRDLLSPKGKGLLRDFQAEADDLNKDWLKLQNSRNLYRERPDPEPLPYRILSWKSEEAQSLYLEQFAEGPCHQALKRFGLLPGQTPRSLPGWELPALPPAAVSLVSRDSFKDQPSPAATDQSPKARTDGADDDDEEETDVEYDACTDSEGDPDIISSKLPDDARKRYDEYLDAWHRKMLELKRNT
ncbi:hypothetical protein HZC53_04095 [Candidatus Uhrbacteria bacterium]|nr:hypothetical protein [Candidatus Uhrbacteria bacterium]